jgi:rare lipoprotein A
VIVVPALVAACAGPQAVTRPPPEPTPTPTPTPTPRTTEESGLISWYGRPHHGRRTANGEVYDMHAPTAAHKTLPFGTWLEVENLEGGQTTRVRVNDRGPFVKGRVLDVSRSAAVDLGMMSTGVVRGRLRVIPAPVSAPPVPAASFAVQVGAFSTESSAHDLHQALTRAGFEVEVAGPAAGAGHIVYRVRSGRFATRADAEAHAAKLRREGYKGIIVSD